MRLSATTKKQGEREKEKQGERKKKRKTRRKRKSENLNTEIFALKVPIYCDTRLLLCLCRQVVRSN